MPEKDYYEKKLEDFNDVFADILNVLLFDGESVILPEELETGMSRSAYKTEGKFEEQERDVKKYWKKQGIRIATAGLENQTVSDNDLAFRIIGYDGAEYRDQYKIRNDIKRDNLYIKKKTPKGQKPVLKLLPDYTPVVTIVLYFSDRNLRGRI